MMHHYILDHQRIFILLILVKTEHWYHWARSTRLLQTEHTYKKSPTSWTKIWLHDAVIMSQYFL